MHRMKEYFRPILSLDPARPEGALTLGAGWAWFAHIEVLRRGAAPRVIPAHEAPAAALAALTAPRAPLAGLDMSAPRLMGIVNVTPDSFSDGGDFTRVEVARDHALAMVGAGCDILDIGGESTRPGAALVPVGDEIARVVPVIEAIRETCGAPISIDTRKAPVARAAFDAGADLINDVAAMRFDPEMAPLAAARGAPICLMHAQGDPETMQADPRYADVLLDVYDDLDERVAAALAAGIAPDQIVVDPGIGFGKTLDHNLALLVRISLFHGLGCPVLLGASRKRFIGTLGDAPEAKDRAPGSIAVALHGFAQGVQITRVHDMTETAQARALWRAAAGVEGM